MKPETVCTVVFSPTGTSRKSAEAVARGIARTGGTPSATPEIRTIDLTHTAAAETLPADAVALFGTDLNAAGMNTIVGYVYDMLYGNSGGYPSYASAAAIVLFSIVLTITCINLLVSKKHVHYV